jgi:hypothetical protein
MKTPPAPITHAAIESVDAVELDDVTGGCRRCGCGTQVAYSYQAGGGGIDPSRLALAFAFSSMLAQNK